MRTLLIFFFVVMMGMHNAWAQDKKLLPVAVIAVVDVQKIQADSLVNKDVQRQLEEQRSKIQNEIAVDEGAFRKAEEELKRLKKSAQPEIYATRLQELKSRFSEVEKHALRRRNDFDKVVAGVMATMRVRSVEVMKEVAASHGANLVLPKQQTLWASGGMDITDEVLERLNKTMPSLKVPNGG